jgi:hypothetical protein
LPKTHAALDYIAIDVINDPLQHVSREFFEVVIVAAVVELWNCVTLP